jgi:lipoate-protein ligase A
VDGVAANQSFLCFERRSPVDIVIDGVKVVGSAQRRTQFGLLQHGSILLRSSRYAPHLAGILDFLDSPSKYESSHSETTKKSSVSPVSVDQNEVVDSLDWEKWTVWLVKNLQVSLEKAFAGYWLFD